MSGNFAWWANRKSRIGLSPSALAPPHLPGGKPWWTTPPTATPQPEHIEYVVEFMLEIQRQKPSQRTQALSAHVSAWLKAARRFLHEHVEADHGELHTTDGLIIAAERAMSAAMSRIAYLGGESDARWYEIRQALQARSHEAKRRRAMSRVAPTPGATR